MLARATECSTPPPPTPWLSDHEGETAESTPDFLKAGVERCFRGAARDHYARLLRGSWQ